MDKKNAFSPLKGKRFKLFLGPTLKLFECVTELSTPFLVRYIIDEGISKGNMKLTIILGLVLFGIAILGFGFTMAAQYLAARVSADYSYDLRKLLYGHLADLSESDLNRFGKQKALTLLSNDSFYMQNGVMMFMRLIFRPPFLLIGATVISFLMDWRAGLIFMGAILLSAFIIFLVILISPKKYAAIQSNLDEISTISNDALAGARPIRAFNKEKYETDKFASSVDSYKKKNMDMAKWNSLINPFTFLFINLALVLLIYIEYRLGVVSDGTTVGFLSVGELVALVSYLTSSLAALVMFSRMIVSLNKAAASKKRIDAFLAYSPSIKNKALYSKKDEIEGSPLIKFDDVSLTYGQEGDKMSVKNLSFEIKKGTWVGMIGGTGSGKSTSIALMERLYEPSKGTISYRGHPLDDYDLDSLRNEISLVSQKPSIYKGTIRSNITIGKEDATEEEIQKALEDSLAMEFVSKYQDGLDHPVEEAGANLSGGQKQRLLIARALLHGGDLLILDDSTSALDFLSDKTVRGNISKIEGLTKIIVSQRAGSLMGCDQILVFDKGEIVAKGTHEELLSSCEIYKEIYNMQRRDA